MRFLRQPIAVRRVVKAAAIAVMLVLLLLYILPNLFMAATYFFPPSDSLPQYGAQLVVIADREDEVCVEIYLAEIGTVHPALRAKFIIGGQVVPFWNLDVHHVIYDLSVADIVCMKPSLAPGEHQLQIVSRANWLDIASVTLPFIVAEDGSVQPKGG